MKKLTLAGLINCYNQFVESPSRRAAHHGNQEVPKQGRSWLTQSYLLYCVWPRQGICFHFHIVSQRPVNTQMSLDKRQTSKTGRLAEGEQQQNSFICSFEEVLRSLGYWASQGSIGDTSSGKVSFPRFRSGLMNAAGSFWNHDDCIFKINSRLRPIDDCVRAGSQLALGVSSSQEQHLGFWPGVLLISEQWPSKTLSCQTKGKGPYEDAWSLAGFSSTGWDVDRHNVYF